MGVRVRSNRLQAGFDDVWIVVGDATEITVRVADVNHHRSEVIGRFQQVDRISSSHTFASAKRVEFVCISATPARVVAHIDGLAFEVKSELFLDRLNPFRMPEQNRVADALSDALCGCFDDCRFLAFGEDDALSVALRVIDHSAHYRAGQP